MDRRNFVKAVIGAGALMAVPSLALSSVETKEVIGLSVKRVWVSDVGANFFFIDIRYRPEYDVYSSTVNGNRSHQVRWTRDYQVKLIEQYNLTESEFNQQMADWIYERENDEYNILPEDTML